MSEWQPMDTAPMDGTTIIVKLSSGREVEAEYWDGPPEKPDWGMWAFNGLASFCEETTDADCDAEWLGWKPAPQRLPPKFGPPD